MFTRNAQKWYTDKYPITNSRFGFPQTVMPYDPNSTEVTIYNFTQIKIQ